MPTILDLIAYGRQTGCSDIHLTADLPPVFRSNGVLVKGPFEMSR